MIEPRLPEIRERSVYKGFHDEINSIMESIDIPGPEAKARKNHMNDYGAGAQKAKKPIV